MSNDDGFKTKTGTHFKTQGVRDDGSRFSTSRKQIMLN